MLGLPIIERRRLRGLLHERMAVSSYNDQTESQQNDKYNQVIWGSLGGDCGRKPHGAIQL